MASKANIGSALFTDRGFERNILLWGGLAALIAVLAIAWVHPAVLWALVVIVPLLAVTLGDLVQTEHSLRRNYPASAHVRSFERGGAFSQASLTAGQVLDPDSLLATRVNGEPLSLDHGAPARIIAPALPGVHCTKWVSSIEFRRT